LVDEILKWNPAILNSQDADGKTALHAVVECELHPNEKVRMILHLRWYGIDMTIRTRIPYNGVISPPAGQIGSGRNVAQEGTGLPVPAKLAGKTALQVAVLIGSPTVVDSLL
jgi:hypothetical protein